MADLIYNPLLKKGFQETSDTGSIEAEIDDLRQHKITKCLTVADLLNVGEGEIIQWQGNTQTIDNVQFVKGYFYNCTRQITKIEQGTPYYHIVQDIYINPLQPIMAGDYYFVANLPKSYINNLLYCQYPQNGNYFSYSRSTPIPPRPIVGDIFFDYVNKEFVNVVDVSYPNYTLSNGVILNITSSAYTLDTNVIKCVAVNSAEIVIAPSVSNANSKLPLAVLSNGVVYPIVLEPYVEWQLLTTQSSVIIPPAFIRVDTQPPTPGITEENGTLKVSFPIQFEDDVTVKGTQTVVHTEEIESENDYIELRADNPLGLANGERSGLEVNNYDGNGTDCILAVDNQGWARVGDKGGTLQKLATIEESPTDEQFVQYDAQNKQLKTAAISEASTTAAGFMSAADKVKLNSFGDNLWQDIIPTLYNSFTGTAKILQYGRFINIYISFSNTSSVGIKSRIMEIPILCNAISYNYVFWCYSGDDSVPPIPILLGSQNNHITIYLAAAYSANNLYTGVFLVLN